MANKGLIATVVVVGACLAVPVAFGIRSYQRVQAQEVERDSVPAPEQLVSIRAQQEKQLASGPVPIDQAMKLLERRPDVIAPQQSDDTSQLVGWVRAPKALPAGLPAAADGGATALAAGDGGTALAIAGDGGATATAGDGGKAPRGGALPEAGAKPPPKAPAPRASAPAGGGDPY